MAFSSLLTLLDDIVSVLDDVALMTKVAAKKTAGVVGDDLALNANQVTGVRADRELPIVWAVAKGSLVNKLILIPAALLLSVFAPALITPLLMFGGGYLCFEGVEKLLHKFLHRHEGAAHTVPDEIVDENAKIKGAIRTDFILSAEIVIIALGVVAESPLTTQIVSLLLIGIGLTVFVYGIVALIVKADDFGLALMRRPATAAAGKAIILFMPWFMRGISIVGTLAMFLVGGGIFAHNWGALHQWLHARHWSEGFSGMLASLLVGLAVGAVACAAVLPLMKLWAKRRG
ncbi:DUF808 domain-containing protein [Eikenella sp. S3360]|uniref:DUF808 domain-containing protein n=1 Tax=Eikenella glucosivorans TaxID=2766967 RepID=A0ABS0N759_9NEIS|nr:DUF808 domain-containing protein [Eikenella glucosivorans]MBH5328137.1 DUF808 domain-containing protein [Eikenella glucosivorans]